MQLTDITNAHMTITADDGSQFTFGCSAKGKVHLRSDMPVSVDVCGVAIEIATAPTWDRDLYPRTIGRHVAQAWHARLTDLGVECTLDQAVCRLSELCDANRAAYAKQQAADKAAAPALR